MDQRANCTEWAYYLEPSSGTKLVAMQRHVAHSPITEIYRRAISLKLYHSSLRELYHSSPITSLPEVDSLQKGLALNQPPQEVQVCHAWGLARAHTPCLSCGMLSHRSLGTCRPTNESLPYPRASAPAGSSRFTMLVRLQNKGKKAAQRHQLSVRVDAPGYPGH